jgi:hypothetical protein
MATFKDLSPYVYLESSTPMINVGWLGAGEPFEVGTVAPEVRDALVRLASHKHHLMRGVHHCELCAVESPIRLVADVERGWVSLGMGEIHVHGARGVVYAAPSLIIHYIDAHQYLPPVEFQRAALAQNEGVEMM